MACLYRCGHAYAGQTHGRDMPLLAALHALPEAPRRAQVAAALQGGGQCVLVDYCLAERNLYLPAVALFRLLEWLMGGHYAAYRAFMAEGGVEGLVQREALQVHKRVSCMGGAVTLLLCSAPYGDKGLSLSKSDETSPGPGTV